jgi:hypothetical protein
LGVLAVPVQTWAMKPSAPTWIRLCSGLTIFQWA